MIGLSGNLHIRAGGLVDELIQEVAMQSEISRTERRS